MTTSSPVVVPVLGHAHVYGYPKSARHRAIDVARYLPLDVALSRAFPTDAHFCCYSVPSIARRLTQGILDSQPVEMVAAVFDVDAEAAHAASGGTPGTVAADEWWARELTKIEALRAAHPGGFVYRTRGGYRLVYVLPAPFTIRGEEGKRAWKRLYLGWVAHLARVYGIHADPSCNDWTRLYRLPHATREKGGAPERRETVGDVARIGAWECALTPEDLADAARADRTKRKATGERKPRKPREARTGPVREGVLFHAFQVRGWIGPAVEPGTWCAVCPWESSHSKGARFDSSTVLFAPAVGEEVGWFHCSHGHCTTRDLRDVLYLFTPEELDRARTAAGLPPRTKRKPRVVDVPREWIEARSPSPPDLVPLAGARDMLAGELRRDLAEGAEPGVRVKELSTGAGKSVTTAHVLQDLVRDGTIGRRREFTLSRVTPLPGGASSIAWEGYVLRGYGANLYAVPNPRPRIPSVAELALDGLDRGTLRSLGVREGARVPVRTDAHLYGEDGTAKGETRRVLVLMDTHEAIEELLSRPDLADLARVAAIRDGRNPEEERPGFCRDKTRDGDNTSGALSRRRQLVSPAFCRASGESGQRCPFAAECAESGYLANLEACKAASVVYAAKALFQSDPGELDGFDVVIVDEDLSREMMETVHVSREDMSDWRAAVTRLRAEHIEIPTVGGGTLPNPYAPGLAVDRWLSVLETAIVNGVPNDANKDAALVPALHEAAKTLGPAYVPAKIMDAIDFLTTIDKFDRYPWERVLFAGGSWIIPLRACLDLLESVREDLARPDGADSRSRLCTWSDADTGATKSGIELRVPRREHLERLKGKVVINLDATPRWPILRALFPEAEKNRRVLSLPERIEVTQLADPLLSVGYLDRILPRINRLLDALTRDEALPVILAPRKRLDPDDGRAKAEAKGPEALAKWQAERARRIAEGKVLAVSNPRAMSGHAGADTRGLNRFEEATSINLVGFFLPNVGALAAEMRAIRAAFKLPAPTPTPGPEEELVPFGWRAADGGGKARWTRRHPDPDVAELVRCEVESYVKQAIGRGRAALRGPAAPPLLVRLLSGYPLPGLKVDRLLTLAELEASVGIAPPAAPTCPPHVEAANAERSEDLRARVAAAVEALAARGEAVMVSAVARELGLTWNGGVGGRLAEHLAALGVALPATLAGQGRTKYIVPPCPAIPSALASPVPSETSAATPLQSPIVGHPGAGSAPAVPRPEAVPVGAAPAPGGNGTAAVPSVAAASPVQALPPGAEEALDAASERLDALIVDWEERAAIREEAGYSREEAEELASADLDTAEETARELTRQAAAAARASPPPSSA